MLPLRLFRVLLSTRLGLMLVSNIGLALGQGSSGRYDILKGTRGESACTLKDDIDLKCITSSTRRDFLLSSIHNRDNNTPPVPSKCTCNAIFFNIWSACCYSTGNNTLPNFTQWTQNCTTSSINVDSSTGFSELQGNLGIDVPSWAKMTVPRNKTFDMQRAVTLAYSTSVSSRWTTLQIILPVLAGLLTLLTSGIVLLTYQRYQRKLSRGRNRMKWPKHLKHLHLHTSHKVTTTIDRDESWEIDPVAKQPSFVNFAPSFDDVHVPVRASSFNMEMTDVHEFDKNSKTFSSLNPTTEKTAMETHSFRIPPRRSRLPWKRRPPYIRLVPATPRFRVDDAKSIFTSSGEAVGRNEVNLAQELVEDVDHVPPEDEETRSLMTASERAERDSQEVILISNRDRFTLESSENTVSVNSYIKIISPSVSSTSPHSVMYPVSVKHKLHRPIPPPPPSHAAPAPPVIPQRLRPTECYSYSNREQSLAYFQSPFLSPIKEASSPVKSYSSSNTNLRRSTAIRRSSNPESVSSLHISPAGSSTSSPPNYFNLHRTASPGPDLSKALGSDRENTTNGQCYYGPHAADNDASIASFYSNSPVQRPVQGHPVKFISQQSADPSAFYAGPVRGAKYSIRTHTY